MLVTRRPQCWVRAIGFYKESTSEILAEKHTVIFVCQVTDFQVLYEKIVELFFPKLWTIFMLKMLVLI